MDYLSEMLERHWPWLVSTAAPAVAAMLFVMWFAVTPHRLQTTINAAETDRSAALDAYLLDAFAARDLDRSRSLDLHELANASDEELRRRQVALFRALDVDGDGVISAEEYRELLLALTAIPER